MDQMDGTCSTHVRDEKYITRVLTEKPEYKTQVQTGGYKNESQRNGVGGFGLVHLAQGSCEICVP